MLTKADHYDVAVQCYGKWYDIPNEITCSLTVWQCILTCVRVYARVNEYTLALLQLHKDNSLQTDIYKQQYLLILTDGVSMTDLTNHSTIPAINT